MAELTRDELLERVSRGESLERVNLQDMQLDGISLVGANLARADLTGANFAGADLRDAILTNASMMEAFLESANLEGATLRNVDLDGANLSGAALQDSDLSRANLEGANLEGAKLTRARLRNATLSDARLGKADLGEANLRSAECTDVYLGGANLRGADLRTAILDGANFEEADLSRADLRECDLSSAILHGATLEGAKVFGLAISRESIEAIRIKWWDVSRAGDGTAREEGSQVGEFLDAGSGTNGAGQHPQPNGPAARFFGEDDVLRNAELEFGAASCVDVQGLFENCSITLGEGAELKIGPAGVIRDCRISGEGNVLIHGQMLNRNGNTPTTSKTFFVGSTGTAVGMIQQPKDLTRFGFEPGCTLRLKIRA